MGGDRGLGSEWLRIEVDVDALKHNAALLRERLPRATRLLAVVKSDAYGHGLLPAAEAFLAGGADMLAVHTLASAAALRQGLISAPVLILGPISADGAIEAARLDLELTVTSLSMACTLAAVADSDREMRLHLKVETGVNRQGVSEAELDETVEILTTTPGLHLVGLSSHFADIEDTVNHDFARVQIDRFRAIVSRLQERTAEPLCRHMSCSAATILWPEAHWDLARVGISAYGIWPSRETLISAREAGRNQLDLRPALSWICRVSQVKDVPAGETVGYGRTWQAPADARIAVLPVGYADGYLRGFSDRGYVLLAGRRAPLAGRICMNLCMVDVTHIPEVCEGDEAVLLGRQGEETISAEQLAGWLNTIPYEILTLPGETWRRVAVGGGRTADKS